MTSRLPTGWAVATVGELMDRLQYGFTASASMKVDGPRFLRITDIQKETVDWTSVPGCDINGAELERYRLANGDVVFARTGSIEKACALKHPPESVFASYLIRGRPIMPELSKWIHSFVISSDYVSQAKKLSAGIGRANINAKNLASITVNIPPLPEQHRIVEALESYLTRLDEAVATLERVQRNLKRYRASVLKAAVEGRLVPTEAELARKENREYEPASILLARILKERKHRFIEDAAEKGRARAEAKAKSASKAWTGADDEKTLVAERAKAAKKYREPAASDASELPELPEGWCWASAEMVYWDAGYGTSQKCTYDSEGPPVLRIPNVQGEALSLDDMKFATEANNLKVDGTVQVSDFLFIRTNGSQSLIGRGATVLRQLPVKHHFASYLIRLRLVNIGEVPRWFMTAWHTQTVRKQLLKDAASSAGQHNVSLSAAKRYLIPLPPERELPRILAELEKTRSIAAASDGIVKSQIDRSNRLRQSILKWAFEGKLVDQNPNDEPASALLDRIKAERSAGEPTKKATRSSRKRKIA